MASTQRSNIVFAFLVAVLLAVAFYIREVLFLIYISALFAVVITPAINFVRRVKVAGRRPGRGLAIFIILIVGLAVMVLFFAFALPPIFHDLQQFVADWPRHAAEITARLKSMPFADRINLAAWQQHLAGALGGVLGVFKGIAGGLFGFFSFLILTAYFILDGERAFYWLMSLFPPARRARLEPTMLRAERRMRHWLAGQATLMLILGVTSTIVFGLLRIKYFYALGVFAGLANIVPILGPVASVILAGTVAAFESWGKLLGVLAFYFVYQQVENALLTPRIMRTTVDLPPLTVIIALAIGGALAGVLGALVAVPTAALIAVLADEYLVQSAPEPVRPSELRPS